MANKTKKTPLTPLQKVLMRKGVYRNIAKPVAGSADGRWKAPQSVSQPYDAAQARENRHLYPHLFTER